MNPTQRIKKTKIQLTQRSSEKYTSHNQMATPPKFRTNQTHYIQTEVSSRQSSRYQTLEHKSKPVILPIPPMSRQSSMKKNPKSLSIDTESINKHYEGGRAESLQKPIGATPLFANQDSTTILHRLHNKRKSQAKVSYDNLIQAIKINYQKKQQKKQQPSIINLSDDYFQISQSKIYDTTFNNKNNHSFKPSSHTAIIKSLYKQINQLRQEIGNNPKLFQIDMLLNEIEQDMNEGRPSKVQESKFKYSQLQSNQIQNSLILKEYIHNAPQRWFTKDKNSTCKKQKQREKQNQRVKTMVEEKQKEREWRQREREREKEKQKTKFTFKSKSPLREIINYVNKKR